jgi:hypothetical protein
MTLYAALEVYARIRLVVVCRMRDAWRSTRLPDQLTHAVSLIRCKCAICHAVMFSSAVTAFGACMHRGSAAGNANGEELHRERPLVRVGEAGTDFATKYSCLSAWGQDAKYFRF